MNARATCKTVITKSRGRVQWNYGCRPLYSCDPREFPHTTQRKYKTISGICHRAHMFDVLCFVVWRQQQLATFHNLYFHCALHKSPSPAPTPFSVVYKVRSVHYFISVYMAFDAFFHITYILYFPIADETGTQRVRLKVKRRNSRTRRHIACNDGYCVVAAQRAWPSSVCGSHSDHIYAYNKREELWDTIIRIREDIYW